MGDFIDALVKHGISAVTVSAGIYMLWYLIKFTVVRLSENIDSLTETLKTFASHVRIEHNNACIEHKAMQDEHKEMMVQLREITITLGRINGYKHHGE